MRKFLIALIVILGVVFANAPRGESGDKPLYSQGKLKIQLTNEAMSSKDRMPFEWNKPYSKTGIASIDAINEKQKASNIKIAHIEAKNKKLASDLGLDRWLIMDIPMDKDPLEVAKIYKADKNISDAIPEYLVYTTTIPSDPLFDDHWGHKNTSQLYQYNWTSNIHTLPQVGTVGFDSNADDGWNGSQGYGSSSIIIAIMDTGVDYLHQDLAAHCVTGYDFGDNDTDPMDDSDIEGHGTCCAGVAAAVANNSLGAIGVAGNCMIMPVKVANSSGSLVGMANAAIYAADNGADVISMSFSGDYSYGTDTTTDNAYTYAYNAGCILMAATSNYNKNYTYYPANHPYVNGVGAASADNGRKRASSLSTEVNSGVTVDPNGYTIDGERWWGSNYGIAVKDDKAAVDFIAPTILPTTDITGDHGYVTITGNTEPYGNPFGDGNYDMFFNGTSCATPYASGAAALVKSKYPTYTPAQIREVLTSTARDVVNVESVAGWDRYSGYGLIDLGPLSANVDFPASITATPFSTTQINLSWVENSSSNDVMVVWNTSDTFGTPATGTTYTAGQTISGGGTVLYAGSTTSYNHTGLTQNTLYYYRAYSYNSSHEYSYYKAVNTRTLMDPLSPSAASLGFENGGSIPLGWTQEGSWTFVTTSTRPTAPSEGSYFAFYKPASAATSKLVTPRFDMSGYSNVTINFKYVTTYYSQGPSTYNNNLKVYYKTSSAGSWVQLGTTYTGNYTTWQAGSLPISDAVLSNDFYIAFEGIYQGTYGVSVDDVIVNGTSGGSPPAVPTLSLPANASSTSDLTPTFDWNDVSGATSYTIQIDNTSNFSSVEYTNSPTTSTYTPASNLATGTWYWRVLATNTYGSSSYTSGWSVILGNPPAAPTLALPSNASSTSDLTPTFDWGDVSGATSYTILVDNNSDFSTPEINQSPSVSTYTPGTDMASGTYSWKVLSTNAFGSSSYSGTWTVTLATPPAVPTLALPTNASSTSDLTPTFDWNDVSGATSYTIQIDNDIAFGSVNYTNSPTASTYTPAADLLVGTWYWRVLATNTYGSSAYTSGWSVTLGSAPAAPSLITPADASTSPDMTPTFDWGDVSGATSYTILVDNTSDFSSPVINQSPAVSTFTQGTDLTDGTYYWKVLSTNAFGSSSYSGTWSLILQAPQPNITLSVSSINTSAAPDATDTDSFNINNTGSADLTYDITKAYVTKGAKADITVHSNDFTSFPGTGYTNSNWTSYSGWAQITGNAVTGVLTSPAFDGTVCTELYLDFDQDFSFRTGSYARVEYFNGTGWIQILNQTAGTTVHQHISLPVLAANMQIRFTGYMTRAQATNAYWNIDNIVVSGPEAGPSYTWLTINSATSGTVTPSGSNTINLTCDATGLAIGTYNADITVATNDPDEPSKVLPVVFVVEIPLSAPINVITTVNGTDLTVSWDEVGGATSYDVYSSTDPYGTYTFVTNVDTESYVTTADQTMLFWYIVAKN